MNKILLPLAALFLSGIIEAQDMIALTGKNTPGIVFQDFRPVNFEKGRSGQAIFDSNSVPTVYSDLKKMTVTEDKNSFNHAQATAMASLAVNSSGTEMYYMPLYSSNIYAMDLATKKITLIEGKGINTRSCDLNSHFTRMCSGADGNIYAMTNSGSQLVQIVKKNNSYQVIDLGEVTDLPANGANSIKIMQTGFGGDMVADANGDLYVFAAAGNVFQLSPKTLTADYLGRISNLPADFSLNGAAVNSEGKVVLASAKAQGYYLVDMDSLAAEKIENSENLNIYDLASKYLVNENRTVTPVFTGIDIYPTMVSEKFVTVKLADKNVNGNVTMEIFNSAGQRALKKTLIANSRNIEKKVEVGELISGIYVVTLKNEAGDQLLARKIIVK